MQFPFFKTGDPQKVFFLSLLIKPFKVGAILFEEINSKLFILSTNEVEAGKDTSELTGEELLMLADKVVSFVEGSLPQGATVEKTIFSVPHSWVEEGGKIKKEYLAKLKKVCEDLGLVPIGYIMSIEAIVHFLQRSEGAPVSAIFVEVAQSKVFVYLVRAGKILEVQEEEVEDSVLKTVEGLLKGVTSVDVLPSKIVLLDYKGVEGVQQEFLSHPWKREIPFLHIPQVIILEKGFENEATINGVASQMELEVLQDVRALKNSPKEEELLEEAEPAEFGFVKDRDIALAPPETYEENKAGRELKKEEEEAPNITYFKGEKLEDNGGKEEEHREKKSLRLPPNIIGLFGLVKKLPALKFKIPFGKAHGIGTFKTKFIVGVIALSILLILFSFFYYSFILKAQVSIFADKKAVDKTENVVFAAGANLSDSKINLELIDKEVKGDDSKNSTGKKETGEKAKGEITIYNKTESKKTFPKGTVIVGPNDLEFILTDEINVASTSSFSTTLSSAKGKVQAAKFGREYNLASGNNFTIKNLPSSSFIGKNSDAITGGTKKETTVVSEKDLDDLLDKVIQKLEKNTLATSEKELSNNEGILPKALSYEVIEKKYTKKEGDEAGSVGISATIKYSIGKYKKEDIQKVVESLSRADIPGTYAFKIDDSKIEIVDIKVSKDKTASAKLKINAIFSPKIESEKLSDALRGKGQGAAEKQIESISGVTDVVISFKNRIPLFPNILPQNSKNIIIEVKD